MSTGTPAGGEDFVLYLDYDGVARIYGFHEAAKFLPEKLRARVIGSTFHSEMSVEAFKQIPRGLQVCQDVERRQPGEWLALDDDAGGWPEWAMDHIVRTDPVAGISGERVRACMEEKLRDEYCSPVTRAIVNEYLKLKLVC